VDTVLKRGGRCDNDIRGFKGDLKMNIWWWIIGGLVAVLLFFPDILSTATAAA